MNTSSTALTGQRATQRLQRYAPSLSLMVASLFLLSGCELVKGIFKAGVGVGAGIVIFFVVLIGGGVALVMRK